MIIQASPKDCQTDITTLIQSREKMIPKEKEKGENRENVNLPWKPNTEANPLSEPKPSMRYIIGILENSYPP